MSSSAVSSLDTELLRTEAWTIQQSRLTTVLESQVFEISDDLIRAAYDQVLGGGKRLRAMMPLAVGAAISHGLNQKFTDDARDAAIWCGLSLELLHAALLCHDDLMDGDRMRRGQPTTWATFGPEQAIVVGDFLLSCSYSTVQFAPWPADTKLAALRLLDRSAARVAHGQALEIELKRHHRLPTEQSYRAIARGKTGGLFSLACAWGGLAAGLPDVQIDALAELGMNLGELYQAYDDLIDLIGDKGRDERGGDLWEGKPSWLVACRAESLTATECERLSHLLYLERGLKTPSSVEELRALLLRDGMVDLCWRHLACKMEEIVAAARAGVPTVAPLFAHLVHVVTQHARVSAPPAAS